MCACVCVCVCMYVCVVTIFEPSLGDNASRIYKYPYLYSVTCKPMTLACFPAIFSNYVYKTGCDSLTFIF